ncbi:hypothetical protein PAMP_016005 [Pampus punctatissimus]
MNTAVTRRHTGTFLPEINNSNKRRRGTQHRMKQECLQTGSMLDKSAQIFSKAQIAQIRNSLKQNICVEMLQEGHHRSFSELFFLLRCDQDQRMKAEPGSAICLRTPLEEQRDKLETMKVHLSRAEQAERIGSWSVMQEQRLFLGRYFSAPEDLWLSLHFYLSCNDRQGSCSRPATEARACLAELYLQKGDLEEAKEQAEQCVKLAEDGGWLDLSGRPLRLRARQLLWRIFNRMADAPLAAADYSEALTLLHKGYSMAAEFLQHLHADLWHTSGSRRTGKGLQGYGQRQYERACQYFLQGYEVACKLGDVALLQKAQLLFCLSWLHQVSVACARTHSLIRKYSADVESATPAALRRLLPWKETRGGQELSTDCTDNAAAGPN